jgi:phage shock protein A
MQEKVNDAMASMTATVGQDSPSLEEVENKIQARMAQASAKAELDASTGEGALAELKRSTMELEASATLDSLRAELGLGSPAELPASEPAPSPETPPSA